MRKGRFESFLVALGGASAPTGPFPAKSKATRAGKPVKGTKRPPSTVLYQDGTGNSWTGRGPQPGWLKELLASGKSLEELKG